MGDAYMGTDGALQRRGVGGGAPRVSIMFPGATEVLAQQYSVTRNSRGQPLQEAVVLPEEYLKMADEKLKKYAFITREEAPAIKAALDANDWQTAQTLFKDANARLAARYAGATEMVTPPPVLAGRKDAEADELEREAGAKLGANFERDNAVADAKAALLRTKAALDVDDVVRPETLNRYGTTYDLGQDRRISKKDAMAAVNAAQAEGGVRPTDALAALVYDKAKRLLKGRNAAAMDAITPLRSTFIKGGGTAEEFDRLVFPQPKAAPGPSTPSPGQFPAPGTLSSLDDLFDQIQAKPWDVAKKRRVFRHTAHKAGLA